MSQLSALQSVVKFLQILADEQAGTDQQDTVGCIAVEAPFESVSQKKDSSLLLQVIICITKQVGCLADLVKPKALSSL